MFSPLSTSSTDPRNASTSPDRATAPAGPSSMSRRDLMAAAAERRARAELAGSDAGHRPSSPRPLAPAAAGPSPALPGTATAAAAAAPAPVRSWPDALRCANDGEPIAPGAAALDANGRLIDAFRTVLRLAQSPAHMSQLAAQQLTCSEANAVIAWLVSHPTADQQAWREAAAELVECPITHMLPTDPVAASDGYTYDREAIEQWLLQSNLSPMTRSRLAPELRPNLAVLALINELDLRGLAADSASDTSQYASPASSPRVRPASPASSPRVRLASPASSPRVRPASPLAPMPAPSAPPLPAILAQAEYGYQPYPVLSNSPYRPAAPLAVDISAPGAHAGPELAARLATWCTRLEDGTQAAHGVFSVALAEGAFVQHPAARKVAAGAAGVVTADDLGMLRLWTAEGRLRSSRKSNHSGRITHLALTPNAKFLVTVGKLDEKVKQWRLDATAGQLLPVLTTYLVDILPLLSMAVSALAVHDDFVAVGGSLGDVGLIGRGATKMTAPIPAYGRNSGGARALAFMGDRLLSGGGAMNKVKSWQLPTLARIGSRPGPGGRVCAIAVQPGMPAEVARVLYGDANGRILLEQRGPAGPSSACIATLDAPVRALFWAADHAYCLSEAGLSLLACTAPGRGTAGSFEVVPVDPDVQDITVAGDVAYSLSRGGRISRLAMASGDRPL